MARARSELKTAKNRPPSGDRKNRVIPANVKIAVVTSPRPSDRSSPLPPPPGGKNAVRRVALRVGAAVHENDDESALIVHAPRLVVANGERCVGAIVFGGIMLRCNDG